MSETIIHQLNKETDYEILVESLQLIDNSFQPKLSSYINLNDYAKKLIDKAYISVLKYDDNKLGGLLAIYVNDPRKEEAYISLIGVIEKLKGKGYADYLINEAKRVALKSGLKKIKLEVQSSNKRAINFYKKYRFLETDEMNKDSLFMILTL